MESHLKVTKGACPPPPMGVEEVGGQGFLAACHLRMRCEGHL